MRGEITIIYNTPDLNRCHTQVEKNAALRIFSDTRAVCQTLEKIGYQATCLPLRPPLQSALRRLRSIKADIIFNLFEGFDSQPETEAIVADFLSCLGIPYTGCHSAALSLALDKAAMKTHLQLAGIDTPNYQVLTPDTLHLFAMDFPCIVKPCSEDGSAGICEESVVYDLTSLEKQVKVTSERFRGKVLVEELLDGREFNVMVLGTNPPTTLPISEIVYSLPETKPAILTFAAKWDPDSMYFKHTTAHCPANIDYKLQQNIIATSLAAFEILGNRGYARIDLRLDSKGSLKVLELNPNPDISPDSGAALQARTAGIEYEQFIQKLVQLALDNHDSQTNKQTYETEGQASDNADTAQYSRV